MDQAYVGLAIQLVGTALAGWALIGEVRSKPLAQTQQPHAVRRHRENSWAKPLATEVSRVSRWDRQTYERTDPMSMRARDRGSHPDTLALAEWSAGVLREYLERAAADWSRQQELERELRKADEQLRQERADQVAQQQQATRRRVVIEMFGLVVVAIGTIIGTAPS